MRASFIQIGDDYLATVIVGHVEETLQEDGRNLKFPSAVKAVAHAQKFIERTRRPPANDQVPTPAEPDIVADWRKERQARYEQELLAVRGVQVIRRKRRI